MNFSSPNLLTVAVNNTLTPFTLPCGQIVRPVGPMYPSGYFRQELIFDFFNYAGIHRSVCLLSLPEPHVTGLLLHPEVVTRLDGPAVGNVWYVVESSANNSGFAAANVSCAVKIFDKDGTIVFESGSSCTGTADLDSPRLWWPIGSESQEVGHMYQLEVILLVDSHVVDIYRQSFGLRSVKVEADGLYINDKLFYFCGFGKHEDFHVFGRGFNLPLMVKDFSLMAWTGANSFRTSHYPYAEEVMEYADQHGVVVIDESPAVGLHEFPNETLKHHQRVMEELVDRDYLHPSVVMWSVANEPKSTDRQAEYYFRTVFDHVRKLDPSRPVTFVIGGSNASLDRAAQFADIICLNHYYETRDNDGIRSRYHRWSSHKSVFRFLGRVSSGANGRVFHSL
ncbi:hypothetical protein RvY_05896-2 [Ramazzottius varieornatus]|uniref:Beta-glucuronidase n=1 Tax=Ramazzottius varieornatus TaxID=947166 RepID=A0A1D1UWQ3_RAMVA|nr:hypothetical protein RvY_05896-2 [Ramazzottius varieornatus]